MTENAGKVRNDLFDNNWYNPGGGAIKRFLWYFVNVVFFINPLNPSSQLKIWLLRMFGAQLGVGLVIKPGVNIKYPWRLSIGDHSWIGERVWIDNLADVKIGSHCCLSQGAMLLTGNHDYTSKGFDLMINPIILEEGVWIGAQAVVAPGVTCKSHSVLSIKAVATKDLDAYGIYQGSPATKNKNRKIL
ncbi:MAG: colanic acid biosynthesis acetyltransferase WcaF [Bacteroidetes bacterium]|nr:colanic acid biosynthesis acetyltransferase WcaF [Bacteroidota bacterium]